MAADRDTGRVGGERRGDSTLRHCLRGIGRKGRETPRHSKRSRAFYVIRGSGQEVIAHLHNFFVTNGFRPRHALSQTACLREIYVTALEIRTGAIGRAR